MLRLHFSLIFLYPSMENFDDTLITACDVDDGLFVLSFFFQRDVLDEILTLTESVSEGFPTYSLYIISRYC